MRSCSIFLILAVTVMTAVGQETEKPESAITLETVTKTMRFLASDELGGRDTPSPGQRKAARYLADRFKKAGLEALGDESTFFHRWTHSGTRIDSQGVRGRVTVDGKSIELEGGRDLRIWSASSAWEAEDEVELARIPIEKAGQRNFWPGRRSERPVLIEVPEAHALWKLCAGPREKLNSRRSRGGAPVLLLRRGTVTEGSMKGVISVPAPKAVELQLENVVAVLRGHDKEKAKECVLVSAHYDHIGTGMPRKGDSIYNGADDDATGTTAVVLLAEALAKRAEPLARSVVFACFSGEEKGLLGSKAFAKRSPWPLADIVANVNIEMIGRPMKNRRKAAWVSGRSRSNFEAIATQAFARAGIKVFEFPPAAGLFTASDNASFVPHGIVAHSISAGSLHQDYHQPSDEVDTLDLEHMTAIIRGLGEVVSTFATRPERPAYKEGGDRLRRRRR